MITPEEFLGLIKEVMDDPERVFDLGTVNPAHAGGRPKVIHDGEAALSAKAYPYIGPALAANDRVLLARVGHTWVVLGKVN